MEISSEFDMQTCKDLILIGEMHEASSWCYHMSHDKYS